MPGPAVSDELVFPADALTSTREQVRILIVAAERAAHDAQDFRRLDARPYLVNALASAFGKETGKAPELPTYDPLTERSHGAFLEYAVPRFRRFDRDLTREGLSQLIRKTLNRE